MSILDYYKELLLSEDQIKAVIAIENFLKDKNKRVFILKGYAGTGKTTLINGLIAYLSELKRLGNVMAPTGRAAKVISDKTKQSAQTIHKTIYNYSSIQIKEKTGKLFDDSYRYLFKLNEVPQSSSKVFIIDEASLVGNLENFNEFFRFGTGKLLDDLLSFANLKNNTEEKIIFIGDPAQLPPVGEMESNALNVNFFAPYGVEEFELKEVVRQNQNSGIYKNAIYYRDLIFSDIDVTENSLDTDYSDIIPCSQEEFIQNFLLEVKTPSLNSPKIIVLSNARAKDYNDIVRQHFFKKNNLIVPGDILIVTQNDYSGNFVILNGDFLKVLEVFPEVIHQGAPIYKDGNNTYINLYFTKIKVQNDNGDIFDKLIINNLLSSRNPILTKYENRALFVNFKIRHPNLNPKSTEFSLALKSDPFFNALKVKYGYAITCHKAQGGEWESVFVDFNARFGRNKENLRWCYTAITRASKKLYTFGEPKTKQVDFRIVRKINIGSLSENVNDLLKKISVKETPFHLPTDLPNKKILFFRIKNIFEEIDARIINVQNEKKIMQNGNGEVDFDIYTFQLNDEIFQFEMAYLQSSFHEFKIPEIINRNAPEKIVRKLKNTPNNFLDGYLPISRPAQILFNEMKRAVEGTDALIIGVIDEFNQLKISYVLKTSAPCAVLEFYFNKNQIFSEVIAKSSFQENDQILRNVIVNLLKNEEMSFKEVKALRLAGQLDDAFEIAKKEIDKNPQNIWNVRSLSWVYLDYLKLYIGSLDFDNIFKIFNSIKNLNLPGQEEIFYDSLTWQIAKLIWCMEENQQVFFNKIIEILEDFPIRSNTDAYSYLARVIAKKAPKSFSLHTKLEFWNKEKFQDKDFAKTRTDDGKNLTSSFEQCYISICKNYLARNNKIEIQEFLPIIQKLCREHMKMDYLHYYHAKLLLKLGDHLNFLSAFLPFARKKHKNFWVWDLISDALDENSLKYVACLAKALTCGAPFVYTIRVKEKMADFLIRNKKFPEAKREIEDIIRTRQENGWKPSLKTMEWCKQDWFLNGHALKHNLALYQEYLNIAHDILNLDRKEETVVVMNVNRDKSEVQFVSENLDMGYFIYSEFNIIPKVGDAFIMRFSENKSNKSSSRKALSMVQTSPPISLLKTESGKVKKIENNSFAFLNNVFIEPEILIKYNLQNLQLIQAICIKAWNKKNKNWGWKVISVSL